MYRNVDVIQRRLFISLVKPSVHFVDTGQANIVYHTDRVHGRRQTGTVGEHVDSLAGQAFRRHRQQIRRRQSIVHRRS